MLDNALYIFLSALESIALLVFMFTIFRFNPFSYSLQIVFFSFFSALLSFVLKTEFQIEQYLIPLMLLPFLIIYLFSTLNISILYSIIVTGISFISFALCQSILVSILDLIGVISIGKLHLISIDMFINFSTTFIFFMLISHFLYYKGYGFTFDMNKFKFKGEEIIILTLLFFSTVVLLISLYINNSWLAIVLLFIPAAFLIYFSIKKEMRDI